MSQKIRTFVAAEISSAVRSRAFIFTLPADLGVRIKHCHMDFRDTGSNYRLSTWRGAAVVVARLQGHIKLSPSGFFTGLIQGHHLSMPGARWLGIALPDNLTIFNHYRPDCRIRANLPQSQLGQGKCLLHVVHINAILASCEKKVQQRSTGTGQHNTRLINPCGMKIVNGV